MWPTGGAVWLIGPYHHTYEVRVTLQIDWGYEQGESTDPGRRCVVRAAKVRENRYRNSGAINFGRSLRYREALPSIDSYEETILTNCETFISRFSKP